MLTEGAIRVYSTCLKTRKWVQGRHALGLAGVNLGSFEASQGRQREEKPLFCLPSPLYGVS